MKIEIECNERYPFFSFEEICECCSSLQSKESIQVTKEQIEKWKSADKAWQESQDEMSALQKKSHAEWVKRIKGK